jgi:GntR family transcriptional regulator
LTARAVFPRPRAEELARRLDCAVGVPVLRIDRLYRDRELRPLELAVNHFNPDRCSGRLQLRRVDPAGPGPGPR